MTSMNKKKTTDAKNVKSQRSNAKNAKKPDKKRKTNFKVKRKIQEEIIAKKRKITATGSVSSSTSTTKSNINKSKKSTTSETLIIPKNVDNKSSSSKKSSPKTIKSPKAQTSPAAQNKRKTINEKTKNIPTTISNHKVGSKPKLSSSSPSMKNVKETTHNKKIIKQKPEKNKKTNKKFTKNGPTTRSHDGDAGETRNPDSAKETKKTKTETGKKVAETVKATTKTTKKITVPKPNKKTKKIIKKLKTKALKKMIAASSVRGPRVASLNASAKVKLLCENDTAVVKSSSVVDSKQDSVTKKRKLLESKQEKRIEKKITEDYGKKGKNSKKNDEKEEPRKVGRKPKPKNKKKKTAPTKRRNALAVDPEVEIIDTRRCKRVASLNASAIMAATYLPETRVVPVEKRETEKRISEQSEEEEPEAINHHHESVVRQWSTTVEHVEVTTVKTMVTKLRRNNTIVHETVTTVEPPAPPLPLPPPAPTEEVIHLDSSTPPKKRRKMAAKSLSTPRDSNSSSLPSNQPPNVNLNSAPSAFHVPASSAASGSFPIGGFPIVSNSSSSRSSSKRKNKQQPVVEKFVRKSMATTRIESSSTSSDPEVTLISHSSGTTRNFDNPPSCSSSAMMANSVPPPPPANGPFSFNFLTPFQVVPFWTPLAPAAGHANAGPPGMARFPAAPSPLINPRPSFPAAIYQYPISGAFAAPNPFAAIPTVPQTFAPASHQLPAAPNSHLIGGISCNLNPSVNQNVFYNSSNPFMNVSSPNHHQQQQRIPPTTADGRLQLHRPVPFHPGSMIAMAPSQIVNVNDGTNQFPNLINSSSLSSAFLNQQRPAAATSMIRPTMMMAANFSAPPPPPTFVVPAPTTIVNHAVTSFNPPPNCFQPVALATPKSSLVGPANGLDNDYLKRLSNMANMINIGGPAPTPSHAGSEKNHHSQKVNSVNDQERKRKKKSKTIVVSNNLKTTRSQLSNGFAGNHIASTKAAKKSKSRNKTEESTVRQQNGSNKKKKLLLKTPQTSAIASTKGSKINHVESPPNSLLMVDSHQPPVSKSSMTNNSMFNSDNGKSSATSAKNRKPIVHGWSWEGEYFQKNIYINNDDQSILRKCYPAIKHEEGDIIRPRDCVLLKSGPRKTDLPFVAKIISLWESPENEMMMSLLWYYRPEHTDVQENYAVGEIYASRHRDICSVACIDDKCYVLTYNEYCRYKRRKAKQLQPSATLQSDRTAAVVPEPPETDPLMEELRLIRRRMPPLSTLPELVFCCRKVYDFRQKRILKNPS